MRTTIFCQFVKNGIRAAVRIDCAHLRQTCGTSQELGKPAISDGSLSIQALPRPRESDLPIRLPPDAKFTNISSVLPMLSMSFFAVGDEWAALSDLIL